MSYGRRVVREYYDGAAALRRMHATRASCCRCSSPASARGCAQMCCSEAEPDRSPNALPMQVGRPVPPVPCVKSTAAGSTASERLTCVGASDCASICRRCFKQPACFLPQIHNVTPCTGFATRVEGLCCPSTRAFKRSRCSRRRQSERSRAALGMSTGLPSALATPLKQRSDSNRSPCCVRMPQLTRDGGQRVRFIGPGGSSGCVSACFDDSRSDLCGRCTAATQNTTDNDDFLTAAGRRCTGCLLVGFQSADL